MRYSKGIMWLDDCRIPFVDDSENTTRNKYENKVQIGIMAERPNIKFIGSFDDSATKGRFTPNLLVCDDVLNDGTITKQSKRTYKPTENTGSLFGNSPQAHAEGIGDKGTNSRYYDLDIWFDKMLDRL